LNSEQVTLRRLLAQNIGLDTYWVENIRKAVCFAVGKLGIPEHILLKPARLTEDEYRIVKEHVVLGAEILETTPSLNELIPIVRHHHERVDGNCYPDGLAGESIPIGARIVALADAVEAMASDRPYRCALPLDQVIVELQKNSGSQFDPKLVKVFSELAASWAMRSLLPKRRSITACAIRIGKFTRSESRHSRSTNPRLLSLNIHPGIQ
jgi:HD-GYP domain-containing protein (c-di-GMP phosphodiesterase class II)